MVKYDALVQGGAASGKLIQSFPPTLRAVFGMNGLDALSLTGYMGIIYIYVLLMAALFAGALGAGMLTEEEQGKTTEFLYVKPRSRGHIFVWKYIAACCMTTLFAVGAYASIMIGAAKYHPNAHAHTVFAMFGMALLVTMWLCVAVGAVLAASSWSTRRAGAITAAVATASYFAYSLSDMAHGFVWLKRFTPFAWFNAKDIIATSSLSVMYIAAASILTVVLFVIAYRNFLARDLRT